MIVVMGKEISAKVFVISIILILIAGFGFIGWLYYILYGQNIVSSIQYSPVTQEPSSFNLDLNAPDDDLLSFDPNILVSGKSAPFASIIITDADQTIGTDANSNGDFSQIITLKEGPNVLTVTAFDKDGSSKALKKLVYYSKEQLDDEK